MQTRKEVIAQDPTFSSIKTLSSISELSAIRISIDIVSAARKHFSFLRTIHDYSTWLHLPHNLFQAIRRYEELWMPLISELSEKSSKPPLILPPIDVQWVWHCHCLSPVEFREYCLSRFSKVIEKAAIFDDENEDYALSMCREIWGQTYPSEPFDLEHIADGEEQSPSPKNDLFEMVSNFKSLYIRFAEPFMADTVFLIAAKHRYRGFLHLLQKFSSGECSRLVPTNDILFMLLTHQSFARRFEEDMQGMEGDLKRIVGACEQVREEDIEATKRLWERAYGQPLERAGANFDAFFAKKPPVYWDVTEADGNRKYKALEPRFLIEVCVFIKGKAHGMQVKEIDKTFLRLRTVRCHRELKMDRAISSLSSETWQKGWHLYCEFGTRGIVLELRQQGSCLGNSQLRKTICFPWNDLLRAESLTLVRDVEWHMQALVSIIPPVQVPYLLKCVPDRVTDDGGAMISEVILRMNEYHPQKGRWLSRTVLDHAGRECFVIRIRIGGGFWRRGGETPAAVKWEERLIEIREGSWSYVAGSVGTVPAKVVGTAIPKAENPLDRKVTWCLSTGDVLTVQWDGELRFHLKNENSDDWVRLLRGRRMQYQVQDSYTERELSDNDEEGFVTLVRSTPESPKGKATALLNWRLFVVEFSPEEDAVLVLLVCMAIIRSVSEMWKEDVGMLLVRRRVRQAKLGRRDWGSVVLHSISGSSSCHQRPWYWNAKEVMELPQANYSRQPNYNYSPADGGDTLYEKGILS